MLHGEDEAQKSEKNAKEAFSKNSTGSNLLSIQISKDILKEKINVLDLVILSKLENSKSEVRRLINGSAIKIDNKIIVDDKLIITKELFNDNYLKLSVGKKRHLKIELI